MKRDEATEAQVRAADPFSSTWLSANAGSGKTRVLTDRVARLLLGEVLPERILCLTYTKAAASEMQNRLFETLGKWAMLPDSDLAKRLEALGVEPGDNQPDLRRRARTLFARAIETPGGLKIQTIHSFCAALLRRFPLEAGVSPRFTEMDERAGMKLREEVLEELALDDPAALDALARHLRGDEVDPILSQIIGARAGFQGDVAKVGIALGVEKNSNVDELVEQALHTAESVDLQAVATTISGLSSTMDKLANKLRAAQTTPSAVERLRQLGGVFAYANRLEFKPSYLTNAAREALGPSVDQLDRLGNELIDAIARLNALNARDHALDLHHFATAFITAYEARKEARGWLDFDDLIQRARALLRDPSVAQWVLFRLDGGIDHILVDEAQDTSPAQWEVIRLLSQEFTAGEGARAGVERTIFVVGDKKQSIYSFQGADPAKFDENFGHFQKGLEQAQKRLFDRELLFSFRTTPPILQLVDQTFELAGYAGLGGASQHRAFKETLPGRIDLWPVVESTKTEDDAHWTDTLDRVSSGHHSVVLAAKIADQIANTIGTPINDENGQSRAVHAGDFLVLVQRRSPLFHEIIRACKSRNLPIAGADRMKIGAEMAVKDLAALLRFLATTEDSLSLAAALRSPLFGWDEDRLFRLAHGRAEKFLWAALRNRQDLQGDEIEMLRDLLEAADFLRPYDLIERILTRHGGRARLLARLGAEAEEGIDVLLAQALAYEANEVPSLTGFITWLETGEVEIKRQAEAAGKRIRVMTVHASKGLESPIVILPDTAKRKLGETANVLIAENGAPVWKMPSGQHPKAMADMVEVERTRQVAERMRLLYVAMTRAKQWLIVCAGGDTGKAGESWYSLISAGLEQLGAVDHGGGRRVQFGTWQDGRLSQEQPDEDPVFDLPDWCGERAPPSPGPDKPLSPSDLGGAKALPGAEGEETVLAMARGTAIHALFDQLPGTPRARWVDLAAEVARKSSSAGFTLDPADLLAEVEPVLDQPELQFLFGEDTFSEVPISAPVAEFGGKPAFGVIDRLVIDDNRVLVVDYKTNATVPRSAGDTPLGILRQMGAYAQMVGVLYPDHRIETAILWTRARRLDLLPATLVAGALNDASPP